MAEKTPDKSQLDKFKERARSLSITSSTCIGVIHDVGADG